MLQRHLKILGFENEHYVLCLVIMKKKNLPLKMVSYLTLLVFPDGGAFDVELESVQWPVGSLVCN